MSATSPPHAHSPSRSTASPAGVNFSDTDFDIDFSSSDDEAGVFFGTPKAVERKIVAALSLSIPATPSRGTPSGGSRRSSLANRVNKRDSREFLRRKTMLLSTPGAGPSGEKVWEGGFHERTPGVDHTQLEPVELEASEPAAGPSTPMVQDHEDIAVDLDSLRLDAFPSWDNTHTSDEYEEEEEDKENTAVPEEWYGDEEDEDEYIPAPPEGIPMTIGFCADQFELDMSPQLDMGNLSILDIDDPEEAPLENGNDTGGAALYMSLAASTSSTVASYDSIDSIASASRACRLQPRSPSPSPVRRAEPVGSLREREDDHNDAREAAHENGHQEHENERVDEGHDNRDNDPSEGTHASKATAVAEANAAAEVIKADGTALGHTPETNPSEGSATTPQVSPELEVPEAPDHPAAPNSTPVVKTQTSETSRTPRPSSPFESLDMFSSLPVAPVLAAPAQTFLDETVDLISFTPLKPNGSAVEVHDGDLSYASDMDSPVGRAPVMIPIFSVASPPKAASPMRRLEPMLVDDLAPLEDDVDTVFALPNLDGPIFRHGLPLFTTSPAASTTLRSPSKLLMASPTKQDPATTAKDERSLARRNAAKAHLDSLFSSKLAPPARGSSAAGKALTRQTERPLASSSKLPPKSNVKSTEPNSKAALKIAELPTKSTALPTKSILKPTKQKPLSTGAQRQAASTARLTAKPSALPRPVAPPASNLPRPALKRPAAAGTAPATSSQPAPAKLFRMAPKVARTAGEAATSLKRPFAATQSTSARSVAIAGAGADFRPTLGMPSRLVRDSVSGAAFFASSVSGSASAALSPVKGGALYQPPARSPGKLQLSQPSKSPGKFMSPSKPVLGKPFRPTGMTPTASRTMPTPQRGMPTPSKAFKLGTPSRPAATPKQRARLMAAVSEERRKSSTPIRAEMPPSPPKWVDQRMDVDEPVKAKAKVEPPVSEPVNAEARVPAPLSPVAAAPAEDTGKESSSPKAEEKEATPDPDTDKEKEVTPPVQENSNSDPPPSEATSAEQPQEQPADEAPASEERPEARRSKRARTPRLSQPSPPPKAPKSAPPPSIVPGMTERALKAATTRNTARNQVYLCTIDRQIVRVAGERPASPSPPLRSERDEEQKAGREARAKRRARASLGEDETGDVDDEEPVVERSVLGRLAPGDEEEYSTPVRRPAKRAKHKLDSSGSESGSGASGSEGGESEERGGDRRVRWDEGLMIIRGGLNEVRHAHRRAPALKSCVTPRARYKLDEHGNAVERPTERLKRTTIRVNAVFYENEEPVAFEYNKSAGGGGGKRKGKK